MERLRRARPFLLLTLLGLPLIAPLLRATAVPCTHDGHLHYHRIAAIRHAWENGLYLTRWLPDLAFGYGYPFFIYRELPPLYLPFFPHLWGMPLPAASNLFYALTILACGWFMFLWVRDVLGERAALVSALAYMTAPYVLVDALVRGNSPESLALPLLPLLLWSGRRWLVQGTAVSFLISAFTLALLSLSHNISVFIFAPTLLVYLAALAWLHRLGWLPALLRLMLLFGLGLGMTIFYTGGALLEMDQVTLQQSTVTRNNDFRFNFATLGEILAPVSAEDPLLLNPPLLFRLGWVPLALALWGVLRLVGEMRNGRSAGKPARAERHFHGWLMLVGTAVYLFFALSPSRPLWENIPLIDFVQFPWRFVGRAALPLAFLAGVPFAAWGAAGRAAEEQESRKARFIVLPSSFILPLTLVLLVTETLPNLYPNYCAEEGFPTINTVHQYERETGLVGVDPEGSYFPRTVRQRPQTSPLVADYEAGRTPQRFDATVLPANAMLHQVQYAPLGATIRLTTPEPFTARYFTFAFPGWVAQVNGTAVAITPSDPEGLITFPVPAGTHTLTIAWRATPLRATLTALSLLALLATLGVTLALHRRGATILPPVAHVATDYAVINYRPLLAVALLLLGGKLLADRVETPLRRVAPPAVQNRLLLQGGELRLEGFNLTRQQVAAGGLFDVDMAWTAVAHPQADYQTNLWLVGPEGLTWSDKDTQRPRLYEDAPQTRAWQPGQWAWDSREVQVLSGTPPGRYDLVLTLFDKATLQPLTLYNERGEALGPTAVLTQIEVTMPTVPPTFRPQFPLDVPLGKHLRLLGYNQDRDTAVPGDPLLLTLFWQKVGAGTSVAPLTLILQDETGQAVQTWSLALARPDFDLSTWQDGQRLRGQHGLRLRAGLESGRYQLLLNGIPLGALQINAPQRLMTMPPVTTAVVIPFAPLQQPPIARLAGYTLTHDADQIALTLVWQAVSETATSYHVFVHLVDGDGRLLAQSDGEPATWSRPTTGWMPGEYISDPHQITLPPGPTPASLTLRVGLYEPSSGQRLQTPTGDFFTIPLKPTNQPTN